MDLTNLIKVIDSGRAGRNIGIPTGFKKLDKIIHGIQRKYFYLIGAGSGVGKSSYTLYTYVFKPLMDEKSNVKVLYYSLELSNEVLFTKLMAIYIWEVYGRRVSFDNIMSLTKPLQDEDFEYVKLALEWLKSLSGKLEVFSDGLSSKKFYKITKQWLEKYGEFEKVSDFIELYHPKDPDQYLICVTDHLALLDPTDGRTLKQEMDLLSKMALSFRNKCGMTKVAVQQLNRGYMSVERKGTNGMEMVNLSDFQDSSGPIQAAEVVLALFSPFAEKMSKCAGYDVKQMGDNIRVLQILKHRYGLNNINTGLAFFGDVGIWKELPKSEEIYNYEDYKNLGTSVNEELPEIDQNENNLDKTKVKFTF